MLVKYYMSRNKWNHKNCFFIFVVLHTLKLPEKEFMKLRINF